MRRGNGQQNGMPVSGMTHLSLFSGIGGLDLAAEWAGFKTVGQCEFADYPTKVLEKHWPNVPRWRDIRTLTAEDFDEKTGLRTVGVISGGFPCQPFSVAGKRGGVLDERYLWPEMLRVINELRPAWVVGENVAGILSMAQPDAEVGVESRTINRIPGHDLFEAIYARHERMLLQDIIGGLEEIGYEVQTFVIPACGVGAWHKRYRIAIVANSGGAGQQGEEQPGTCGEWEPYESAREFCDLRNTDCGNIAWNNGRRKQTRSEERRWRSAQPGLGRVADGIPDWVDGYWDAEPEGIPRVTSGIPNRAERLKALGNAVVPQQFYPIFKSIADVECPYQG